MGVFSSYEVAVRPVLVGPIPGWVVFDRDDPNRFDAFVTDRVTLWVPHTGMVKDLQ